MAKRVFLCLQAAAALRTSRHIKDTTAEGRHTCLANVKGKSSSAVEFRKSKENGLKKNRVFGEHKGHGRMRKKNDVNRERLYNTWKRNKHLFNRVFRHLPFTTPMLRRGICPSSVDPQLPINRRQAFPAVRHTVSREREMFYSKTTSV